MLDPFAGSGALGLEALSRGAARAEFCELRPAALRALAENVERLGYADRCVVRRQDGAPPAARPTMPADRTYDLMLIDPPYRMLPVLQDEFLLHLPELLAPAGRLVIEGRGATRPRCRFRSSWCAAACTAAPGSSVYRRCLSGSRSARAPTTRSPFGHLDIIRRASAMFDRVVVGVVRQPRHKYTTMFSLDERIGFIQDSLDGIDNVVVEGFSTLVVEFARGHGARAIVKGLRAVSDFEWEFQMQQPEPRPGRGYRDDVPDGVAAVQFPIVARRARDRVVRRPGGGVRARSRWPDGSWNCMRPARSEPQAKESHVDVLVLIDKLDDLVLNARGVPMSNQVRLDRDEIEDIISHMRSTIPEEIKQARWIVKERQEMLAEAKREAERLISEAREHAAREASQQEVVKLAERQAEDIITDARRKAREMRLGADDYADSILENMETNLTKFLAAVQRGREQLAARSEDHTGPATAGFDMSQQT